MEKQNYITPEIEVIEVAIEQGFATSPGYEHFGEETPLF